MQSSQVRNVGLPSSADTKRDVPAWTQDPKIFPLDWFSLSRPNIIRQTKEYVSKLSKWRNCSKIKTLSKLKAVLKRIMMFLHTHISYIDGKSLLECDLEEDLITLVSLYMDMELRVLLIKKSPPSGAASTLPVPGPAADADIARNDKLVSDRIAYWLYTMLSGHDQRMDALLSITVFTRHTRPVLDPIFRKVLSEMSDGPFTNVNYVRHMLAYKTWRERTLVVNDSASLELNSRVLQQLVPRDYAFPPPLLRCLGKGDNAREHARPHNINLTDACRNFMRYCREIPAAAVEQINFESIPLFDDDLLGDEEDEVNKLMNMISNRKQRKSVSTSPKRSNPQVDAFIDLTLPKSRTSPSPMVDVIDLTEEDEKHVMTARTAVVERSIASPLRIAPPVQRDTSKIPQTPADCYHALVPSSQSEELLIPHHDQDLYLFNICICPVRAQYRQAGCKCKDKTLGYQKNQETVKVPVTERNCEKNAKYVGRCFQFSNYLYPSEDDVDTEVQFGNSQDQMNLETRSSNIKCNRQGDSRKSTKFSDILNNCDCDECRQDSLSRKENRTCGSAENNKTEISDNVKYKQSLVTYSQTSTVAEIYGMEKTKPIKLYPQSSLQLSEDKNKVEYFSETLDKRKFNSPRIQSFPNDNSSFDEISKSINENESQILSVKDDVSNKKFDIPTSDKISDEIIEISEQNAQTEIQPRVSDTRTEIDQLCSEIADLTSPEISFCDTEKDTDFLQQSTTGVTEISCNTSEEPVPDVTVRKDNLCTNTEDLKVDEEISVIPSVQSDSVIEETPEVTVREDNLHTNIEDQKIDEEKSVMPSVQSDSVMEETPEVTIVEETEENCLENDKQTTTGNILVEESVCQIVENIPELTQNTSIEGNVDYLVQNENEINSISNIEDKISDNVVQINERLKENEQISVFDNKDSTNFEEKIINSIEIKTNIASEDVTANEETVIEDNDENIKDYAHIPQIIESNEETNIEEPIIEENTNNFLPDYSNSTNIQESVEEIVPTEEIKDYVDIPQIIESNEETNIEKPIIEENINNLFPDYPNSTNVQEIVEEIAPTVESEIVVNSEILESDFTATSSHEIETVSSEIVESVITEASTHEIETINSEIAESAITEASTHEIETVSSEIVDSVITEASTHEIETMSSEIVESVIAEASTHEIKAVDHQKIDEINQQTISEPININNFEIETTNLQSSECVDVNHSNSEIIIDSEITVASTHEIETNTSSEFLIETKICSDVEIETTNQQLSSESEVVNSEITISETEHQKSSEFHIDTEICTEEIETIKDQIISDSAIVDESEINTEICFDNNEIKQIIETPSSEVVTDKKNSEHFVDNIEISTNITHKNSQTSKRKRRKVISTDKEEQVVHIDKNIQEMSPTKRKRNRSPLHMINEEENIVSIEPINLSTEIQNYEEIITETNIHSEEQINETVKDNTPIETVPKEQISVDYKQKRRRKQNLKNSVRDEKKEKSDNVKKELRIVCQKLSPDDLEVMSKTNQTSIENKVAVTENNKMRPVSRRKNQTAVPNKDIENSVSQEMKVDENELNKITVNTEKGINKTVDIPSFSEYISKEKEKQNKFRGRPRKKKQIDNNENTNKPLENQLNVSNYPEINVELKVKRPRGRPPKNSFFSENLNLQNVNSKTKDLPNDASTQNCKALSEEDIPLAVRKSQSPKRTTLKMAQKNPAPNLANNFNIEEDLPLIERKKLKSKPIRTYSKAKVNTKEENDRVIENNEVDNEIKSKSSYREKLKIFKFKSRSPDDNLIAENNLEISNKNVKNSKRKFTTYNSSTSTNDTLLFPPIPDIISSSFIKPKKTVRFSDKDDVFPDNEEYINEMKPTEQNSEVDTELTSKKNSENVIYRAKRNRIKKFREIPNEMQTIKEYTRIDDDANEITDKSSFNKINIDGDISKTELNKCVNNFSCEEIIPEKVNFHLTPKKMFSRRAREKLEKKVNLEQKIDSQIMSNEKNKVNSYDKQINNSLRQFPLLPPVEEKIDEIENKPLTEICVSNYEEENSSVVTEETVITSTELTETISKFQNEINLSKDEKDISKNAISSPIKKTRKSKFPKLKIKLNGKSNFLPIKLNKNVRTSPTLKNRKKKKFKTKLNGNNNNKNVEIAQSEELKKKRDMKNDLKCCKSLDQTNMYMNDENLSVNRDKECVIEHNENIEIQPEELTIEKTEINYNLDTNYTNNDQKDIDINKTEENTTHLDEIPAKSCELNEIDNNKIEAQIPNEEMKNVSEEENQDGLTTNANKIESPKIDNKSADMSYKPCNKIYEKQFDFYPDHDDVSNSELIIDTSAESSDSEDVENKKENKAVQQKEVVPKRKYHHLIEEIVNLNENAEGNIPNNFENVFNTENVNRVTKNISEEVVDTFNYSDISDEPQESDQSKMEIFQQNEECIQSTLLALSVDESEIKDIVEYRNIAGGKDVEHIAEITELYLPDEVYDEFSLEKRKEEKSELFVVTYRPSVELNMNIEIGLESCTIYQTKPLVEEFAKKACVKCSVNGVHKNNGKITLHGSHQYEEIEIGDCLENCPTIPPISYCQGLQTVEINECILTAKVESVKISTNDLDNYNLVFLADIAMSSVHLTTKIDCNSSTCRQESTCNNQNSMDSHDKCIIVTFPDNMTPSNKPTTSVSVIRDKSSELSINVQTIAENVSPKGIVLENKIQALTERVKNSKKSPTENLDELYTSLENICELEINTLTKGVDSQSSTDPSLENPKLTEPSIPIDIPNTAHLHLIPDDDDFIIRNEPFSLQSPPLQLTPLSTSPETQIKSNLDSTEIDKSINVDSAKETKKSTDNKIDNGKEEIKTKSKKAKSKQKSSNNQNSETNYLLNVYKSNQDTNKNSDVNNQQNVVNKNTPSPPSYIRSTRPMRMVTTKKRNCNMLETNPQDEPPKKVSASEEMFDLLLEEHRKEQSKTPEKNVENGNPYNTTMPILDDDEQNITDTSLHKDESNIPLPVLDYEPLENEPRKDDKEEIVKESEGDIKIENEKEIIVQEKDKQTDESTDEERAETDRNASAIEVVQEWFNRVDDKTQAESYTEITSYQTIEECNFFEEMSDTSENSPNSRKTDDKIFSEHQTPDSGIAFDEDSIHKDKPVPENLSDGGRTTNFYELDETMSESINEKVVVSDVQLSNSEKEQLKVSISLEKIQEILPHLKKCKVMSSVQKNRKRKDNADHEKPKRRKYSAEIQQDINVEEIVINNDNEEVKSPAPNQKEFPITVRTKGSVKEYPELFGITESPVPSGSFHSPYPSDISLSEEQVFSEEGGIDLCSNDYQIYDSFEVFQEQQSLQKEYNVVDDNPKDVQQGLQAGYCVVDSQFLPLSEYMNDGDYILIDNKIFNDKKMVPVNMHLVQPETKPHKNEETKKSEFDDSEKEDSLSDTVDEIIKNPNLFPEQSTSEVEVINMDQATSEVQVVIACGTYQETDMSDTYLFGIAVQSEVTHNTTVPDIPLPHHSPMTIEELPPENKVTDSDFKPTTSMVGSDNTQICNTNILPATDVPQPQPMDLITTVPSIVTDKILDNKEKLLDNKKLDDINYKPKTETEKVKTQKKNPRRTTVSELHVSNSSKISSPSLHTTSSHNSKIFQNSNSKSSNIIIHQNKLLKQSDYQHSNKISNGPNSLPDQKSQKHSKVHDSKKSTEFKTNSKSHYEKTNMSEDAFDRLKHDKTDIPPPPDNRRYYNSNPMKTRHRKDTPSGDYYRRYSIERDSSKSRHTSQNFSESRRPHSAYTEPNPKQSYRLPASDPSYRNSHNNYRKPEVKKPPELKQPPPGSSTHSQKDWLKNENLLSLIKASNTIYSKKY